MTGRGGRLAAVLLALTLVAAACGDDDAEPTSTTATTLAEDTTTTTERVVVTTSTTSTTEPEDDTPGIVDSGLPTTRQGDLNDFAASLQFLLNCNGYGDLTVDGAFGPATRTVVEEAQADLGLDVDGVAGPNTFLALLQTCDQPQRLDGDGASEAVGYATSIGPTAFRVALVEGSELTIVVPAGLEVTVQGADGAEVPLVGSSYTAGSTQDHTITVASAVDAVGFVITIDVEAAERSTGDWILATDSITYKGDELAIGDDAETVIDSVFEFLGHGLRGNLDEFDTDWSVTEGDDPIGIRGIFIEGLAFLFFGPSEANPTRAATLERVRFVGPGVDGNGDPRPDDYVTTGEGITVGDSLAELQSVYGTSVTQGNNADEFYYRLTNSGGELCFYFGASEPDDLSTITEMSTECRD